MSDRARPARPSRNRARPARLLKRAAASSALVLGALSLLVAPAGAAQRLESFALPSTQGNIDVAKVELNKIDSLRATVLLPDGYDEHPDQRWPVLYLLHGLSDNSSVWAQARLGNITKVAAGFNGIVVMPEGGRGFFSDRWQGGKRDGARWTRYYLDEVLPAVEARYRIAAGRQSHAIGGVSMGAYGSLFLAGQLPGYFGTVLSMSALVDLQSPEVPLALSSDMHTSYESVWGGVSGPYATAHNPMRTIENLAGTRIYLYSGSGVPDLSFGYNEAAWTKGVIIEARVLAQNLQYAATARQAGVTPTLRIRTGVHDWPYWRRELPLAIRWNLFGKPPVAGSGDATRWSYKTMEPTGNAWGIGYRFEDPAQEVVTFARNGQTLTGVGDAGRTVTINPGASDVDATGAGTRPDCSFTATLPFERTLPAGC